MKILVTGGAGFIGSNFIRLLLNKYPDYEITNLDKLTYSGNLENLKDIEQNDNYGFVKGDICNAPTVNTIMKGKDIVVNFAAESHVDRSIKDPDIFLKTDIFGVHNLLDAVKKNNIKKFVQISTDEVYGSIAEGSFTEDSPLQPNSPYSASKAGADMIVRGYNKTFGIPTVITRSSNNFGPYQYPEKLIPLAITNLLENKKVPIYGDGQNVRDWIYVEDNCEAIDLVMHKGDSGEIYNIGGNNEKTNIDIIKMIIKDMDLDESAIEFVKDRQGHDKRYSVDCSKIQKLGWKAKKNFNSSINETISWYKNNKEWWQKIKSGEFLKYYEKHYNEMHQMKN